MIGAKATVTNIPQTGTTWKVQALRGKTGTVTNHVDNRTKAPYTLPHHFRDAFDWEVTFDDGEKFWFREGELTIFDEVQDESEGA